MHLEHLRVDVSATGMRIEAVCGPPTVHDDIACVQGSVIDSYTIGTNPPPPHAARRRPCMWTAAGRTAPTAGRARRRSRSARSGPRPRGWWPVRRCWCLAGTYNENVTVSSSGTATAPVNFVAEPGEDARITGGSGNATNGFYISAAATSRSRDSTWTGTTSDGIVVKNSSNITLRGNHVSYSGQPAQGKLAKGIRVDGTNDSVVSTNTVDHNTDLRHLPP